MLVDVTVLIEELVAGGDDRVDRQLVSPKWLFLSSEQIRHATLTLDDFRSGKLDRGQYSDAELWKFRQVYEAAVHPQTGETVPAFFRLSAFVPVNIPICVGMLLATPTLGNTIFWQWVNQSYSAGFNYANRNASSDQDNLAILKSYATATFVSCSTAVGLGKMVDKAKGLSPNGAIFHEGIDIMDEYGEVHGRSVAAGRQSLGQVALTRVALPMPILLLPPYLYEAMNRRNIMPKAKFPKLATELVILTLCLWGAMPSAVALFPQMGTISADNVEEEFHSRVDCHGQPIRHFLYNKGI
ncbi:mitochondrial tricarboxylate carrier family [Plasmopara halstedii]|uniref:Mitochondrial tricarboxylate carrier family n=1 Tax=Plasmopara halstedii TaxID=4781 RepID=A0A0P1AHA0_PLAHL|nr:mitochondrial tricarboxylate carrier family [Plasmopara halstedii]CEG40525.1 mitochondrial tricarboxylate carrier family [Plasmopara halstedii]|eukprot:XP_024576894.1 mitochondrial tricarboxylate carrier family [Plasmopara halstedii]